MEMGERTSLAESIQGYSSSFSLIPCAISQTRKQFLQKALNRVLYFFFSNIVLFSNPLNSLLSLLETHISVKEREITTPLNFNLQNPCLTCREFSFNYHRLLYDHWCY
jgi:hypothetical protein